MGKDNTTWGDKSQIFSTGDNTSISIQHGTDSGRYQPEHDSVEILRTKFCFPLQLGKLNKDISNSDSKNIYDLNYLFEFPLCWQENSEHVSLKLFERETQEDVLKQWEKQTKGVFLILGEPGGGKTTVLRQWRKRFSTVVVEYVALRDLGCIPMLSSENKKTTVWLLDGWDELPSDKRLSSKAIDMVSQLPGIKIITCRTMSYHDELDEVLSDDGLRYLMGMLPSEQRLFLTKFSKSLRGSHDTSHIRSGLSNADESWCEQTWLKIQCQPAVRPLAGSPLLLVLFAVIYAPNKKTVEIKSRNDFYEHAYTQLCEQRHPIGMDEHAFAVTKSLLIQLAGSIKRSARFTKNHLVNAFGALQQPGYTYTELVNIATTSEIVRESGTVSYEFLHLTFQEWFLAQVQFKKDGLLNTVREHWSDSNFIEVLAMVWAMSEPKDREQATEFLTKQQLISPGENRQFVKLSGINTALELWHRSGVDLSTEETIIKKLLTMCTNSKLKKLHFTSSSSTPTFVMEYLASDRDSDIRKAVANSSYTETAILKSLASDSNYNIRMAVAENPKTPEAVRKILASDRDRDVQEACIAAALKQDISNPNYRIRMTVVKNPYTPKAVLKTLANDPHYRIRMAVADNTTTPKAVLKTLAGDSKVAVRLAVAKNFHTQEPVLKTLASDPNYRIRTAVADNSKTPNAVLKTLASDSEVAVRLAVAKNFHTKMPVLKILVNDQNEQVRWAAVNAGYH